MKRLLLAFPLLLLALVVAGAPLSAQSATRKDRNRITEEEVRGSSAQTVYDLVRNQRPQWLRTRGNKTMSTERAAGADGGEYAQLTTPEIIVYLDGIRFGKDADLRTLPVSDIATLQFLDASSATQRFGTGHPHGAILLTRRQP